MKKVDLYFASRVFFFLVALILAAGFARAQVSSGTITGVVKDSSGAVIPGAKITILDVQQGLKFPAVTTAAGLYARRFLPVGRYTVSAVAPGFKESIKKGLVLSVGQTLGVNFTLQIGKVTQAVEVKAGESQLLQTETSEVGQVINHQQVTDLPLNGRNFANLIPLNAGVTTGMQGASNTGYNLNGGRSDSNMFLINGTDNVDINNNLVLSPPIDAIQEFQVQTSNYSAEFGQASGGIVQVELRSGTDKFHGSLFEFLRNNAFDANGFFNNMLAPEPGQNHAPIQPLQQSQFGGTLGGPIIKDRLFFFADYQGTRTRSGNTEIYSVPTALERAGNFSQTMPAGTPIYQNALLGQVYPGCDLAHFTAACQIIPSSALDPVAEKVANFYPLPNQPGLFVPGIGTFDNYVGSGHAQNNVNNFDTRLDFMATEKDTLSFHYSFQNSDGLVPAAFGGGEVGPCVNCGNVLDLLAGSPTGQDQNTGLTYIRSLTPTLVNEVDVGVNRTFSFYQTADGGKNLAQQLGMANVNVSSFTTGLPWFDFSPAPTWTGTSPFTPNEGGYTAFQITDNLSWIHGKHRIKAGFNMIRRYDNGIGNFFGKGAYIFAPFFTGNQFADFMTGRALVIEQDLTPGTTGFRDQDYGAYFQDDYKVRHNLTLNLGVRYDLFPGMTEAYNRFSNLNLATGKVTLAGLNGAPRSFMPTSYDDFSPRIGFAYAPGSSGKWVLRGGYGISYENPNNFNTYAGLNPPYTGAFTLFNIGSNLDAQYTISDGLPVQLRPTPQNFDPNNPSGNWRVIDPYTKIPYVQMYSFGVERALGWNTVLDVSYVGSRSNHLPGELDGNPTLPGPTSNVQQRSLLHNIAPNVQTVTYYSDAFLADYNSLQVKVQKTFSHGLQFLTTYTYGKSMDNKSGSAVTGGGDSNPSSLPQDSLNLRAEYARSSYDVTHNFVTAFNYDLPFGHGQHFGSGWNPVVDGFLGGWQMNGIVTLSTGLPFSVFASSNANCGCTTGELRADRIGNGNLPAGQRSIYGWFNKSAFTDPPSSGPTTGGGAYGNAGRNIINGPGYADLDYSVFKKFMIKERVELQFRAEVFNLFNDVNYYYPLTVGNATWQTGGLITQAKPARIGQLALKIIF